MPLSGEGVHAACWSGNWHIKNGRLYDYELLCEAGMCELPESFPWREREVRIQMGLGE